MENTDLRTDFTTETKTRFNVEWVAYNDYVEWLERKLVKLLTIPPVIRSVCDINRNPDICDESDIDTGCIHCDNYKQTDL
ncbi:MAG: hypothetical protein UR61_C0047G0012 [candidate division WS6 bacterium GW2011_GWE1_34_7]|uniref:Uncharacterized protein n=1 Tax=candidate division WS6 bacterium GW2011_GWE1_34_7 TaxID=1619093 RepID=A0A0G0DMS4_9BACT|nr:MAG: hypothetical protein UR61_C0047G0012 [candidate division WS6 bacterium GW2011_GWE1_34_7]